MNFRQNSMRGLRVPGVGRVREYNRNDETRVRCHNCERDFRSVSYTCPLCGANCREKTLFDIFGGKRQSIVNQ